VTSWKDADGDAVAQDHVRVTAGMFAGKVGKVVEVTKKGYKVAVGDFVFEVNSGEVGRVVEG